MNSIDRSRSVVNPWDFVAHVAMQRGVSVDSFRLPRIGVVVFGSGLLRVLAEGFGASYRPWLFSPDLVPLRSLYIGSVDGREVVVMFPGIGASISVVTAEEMIACGVERLIIAGYRGSIVSGVNVGDIVVSADAIIDEGTSRHYIPDLEISRASEDLLGIAVNACRRLSARCHVGRIWSTDAPYRETVEKILRFRGIGALCVYMETSALYTLASFRGVEAVALHIVSDDLSELVWRPAFVSENVVKPTTR